MHEIQQKLLTLSKEAEISRMTLRDIAAAIEETDASPQKIKHHLMQLEKKGFKIGSTWRYTNKGIGSETSLFSIPVIGTANCGPANVFAETNFQGFLKLSSKLLNKRSAQGLFAIKADGSSMNRAEIGGKKLEDGDYAIIDSTQTVPSKNDVVLAIIDGKATIKRFIEDKVNEQIVLIADSSYDYEPIYLHQDDEFSINGKVINVIKRPNIK